MSESLPGFSFLEAPSGPLVPWRRYPFPLAWQAQFQNDAPLHLEIGFGDGRYTVRRAAEFKRENFVGMEISSASLQRGLAKVRRAQLENVKLLKVGAQFGVQHLFAPESLTSITVNFPDPWPKERHEKHRLLSSPFFELVSTRLQRGGALFLATDHPEYLDFSRAQAAATGLFRLEEAEPPAAVFETKYALKWKTMGKPLFYQVFHKEAASDREFPILLRSETMPHAVLKGSLPATYSFEKQVLSYKKGHVILHEVMQVIASAYPEDVARPVWRVRATLEEPELRQQLLVSVRTKAGGKVLVGLEPFGDPVVTEAAHGAVHAVTEWLLQQNAGLEVESRAY